MRKTAQIYSKTKLKQHSPNFLVSLHKGVLLIYLKSLRIMKLLVVCNLTTTVKNRQQYRNHPKTQLEVNENLLKFSIFDSPEFQTAYKA